MGRRKIEIQPLTDDRNRTVTFVKRKAGLFKKAHELAVLCQVDLAVIIIGNNDKLYEFLLVETSEILQVYRSGKRPHELKLPENYGNYKKKKHIHESVLAAIDDGEAVSDDGQDGDSDYESELPEPKRQKRLYEAMSSGIYKRLYREPQPPQTVHSRESLVTLGLNQRPILRVQIPIDAKGGSTDSAKTVTAMETGVQSSVKDKLGADNRVVSGPGAPAGQSLSDSVPNSDHGLQNPGNGAPNINTPKYRSFGTFRSPDSRKPITQLPLPIQGKSQTSSPSSATAPPLPSGGMATFFGSLPQPSPAQYAPNAVLPTPVLNQVFNQQYGQMAQPGSTNAAQHAEEGSQVAPGPKQKPPYFQNQTYGETPVSGLPSRYVNDIFPSPSNFYASQEWPTGMTPIHSNIPQYFMNMMPSANGTSAGRPQTQQTQQTQQPQQQTPSLQGAPNQAYQTGMASPLQYGTYHPSHVNVNLNPPARNNGDKK